MVQQNELMQSIKGYVLGSCTFSSSSPCLFRLNRTLGLQQPPQILKSGYMPRQICQPNQPQQVQCQAPPPYSTDAQQSQYHGRSGEYCMPPGGLLTPSVVTYASDYPATSDIPMQDAVQSSSSPNISASRPSPFTQESSPWSLSPPMVYSSANQGGGGGLPVLPLSPISPSGPQELGGLGNVGMSVGEGGEADGVGGAMGDVNPYFLW